MAEGQVGICLFVEVLDLLGYRFSRTMKGMPGKRRSEKGWEAGGWMGTPRAKSASLRGKCEATFSQVEACSRWHSCSLMKRGFSALPAGGCFVWARRACLPWAKCSCIVQEMAHKAPDEVAALDAAVRAATSHVQNLAKIMVSSVASSMRIMTPSLMQSPPCRR